MPTPDQFEASLKAYDPQLRLRWGPALNRWVVERKQRVSETALEVYQSFASRPDATPMDAEKFISAKRGCHPVLSPLILGDYVFKELWVADLQVHGTAVVDRYMKRLEDNKARRRAAGVAASHVAADALEYLNRRDVTDDKTRREVLDSAFEVKASPKRKPKPNASKVVNRLGKPPKWMRKDATQVGA